MNHLNNEKLLALDKRWKWSGDWLVCRDCKNPLIASRDGEPLHHKDGCRNAAQKHPWRELRDAMSTIPAGQIGVVVALAAPAFQFKSFEEWVNHASKWFRRASLLGDGKAVCIDAAGRICMTGKHFIRARDEGAFPVAVFALDPQPGEKAQAEPEKVQSASA